MFDRVAIPMAGLALTFACADRSPTDEDTGSSGPSTSETGGQTNTFIGPWNLVSLSYDLQSSNPYTQEFPVAWVNDYYSYSCVGSQGIDLRVVSDTLAQWVTQYSYACDGQPPSTGGSVYEWEIEIFDEFSFGVYQDMGYVGDTGYTESGYTATSAGTADTGVPERELAMVCTRAGPELVCTPPDPGDWEYRFARPACQTDTSCNAPAQCFWGQCVVPQSYGG